MYPLSTTDPCGNIWLTNCRFVVLIVQCSLLKCFGLWIFTEVHVKHKPTTAVMITNSDTIILVQKYGMVIQRRVSKV